MDDQEALRAVAKSAIASMNDITNFIEQAPGRINAMCFGGGAAVVLVGLLTIINVFNAMSHTLYYVVNTYQVFFGVVTCLTELHPAFAGRWHDQLQHWQAWMHEWAKGLTLLWGRGLFYIFQGLLCCVSCFSWLVGIALGMYMLAMGGLCIQQHFKKHPGRAETHQDYIVLEEERAIS